MCLRCLEFFQLKAVCAAIDIFVMEYYVYVYIAQDIMVHTNLSNLETME